VFTDYIKGLDNVDMNLSTPAFVRRDTVQNNQYINPKVTFAGVEISLGYYYVIYGTNDVVQDGPYGYEGTSNVGGMLTDLSINDGKFTAYYYVNPRHDSPHNATLQIYDYRAGVNRPENSNAIIDKVEVYNVGNMKLPGSVGVENIIKNLQPQSDLPLKPTDNTTHKIELDFGEKMATGNAYIVKINGSIDSVGDSLYLRAKMNSRGYYTTGIFDTSFYYDLQYELNPTSGSGSGKVKIPQIDLHNIKPVELVFKKINKGTQEKPQPIKDAEFELYEYKDNKYKPVIDPKTNQPVKKVSGQDGEIKLSIEDLHRGKDEKVEGQYAWKEVKTPTGYKIPKDYRTINGVKDENGFVKEFKLKEDFTLLDLKGESPDAFYMMIENEIAEAEIEFVKIDGRTKDYEKPNYLEAEFTLYKLNENSQDKDKYEVYKIKSKESATEKDYVVKSNPKDGKFKFEKLPDGKYAIKETTAPEGYVKPENYIVTFKASKGKIENLTYTGQNDGGNSIYGKVQKQENGVNTINYIYNYKSEYPATGGIGTLPFMGIGLMLMSAAYVLYNKNKFEIEGGEAAR
ncbi:SpaA isopeptide-forming pilin-related protein, partial [Peptoniphilus asaccharolyticus]